MGPELPHLTREFARVVVVPASRGGNRANLPDGVEVDESLATDLAIRRSPLRTLRDALACPAFAEDVRLRVLALRSVTALRRLVAFASTATHVARWYGEFGEKRRLDHERTILYAYWFDALSAGLALARAGHPSLIAVARGHRADVYEDEQTPPYLPCRGWLLRHVQRIYLVSQNAYSYLLSHYPEAGGRLRVSRLGTPEPGFRASPSADGTLRMVSCSAFFPVKQVDVLARGLVLAAVNRPSCSLEWHHFGEGPLRQAIERVLGESAPPNLSWALRGHVSNAEVLDRYRSHPTDLFMSTSRSEGIPVSIMEAQSCGIPVIAPAVGGVPEAVSPENGFLLPAAATPGAVAETVGFILSRRELLMPRREQSRLSWEARFRADDNHAEFARQLAVLCHERKGAAA